MNRYFTFFKFLLFIVGLLADVPAAGFVIPKAPAGLFATTVTHNQVTLTWVDASTDETGFELERSLNGTTFIKVADLAVNVITYTDINLLASTNYWYRIRSKNVSGFSAYSNVLTVTTKAPPITIPKAPTNLAAAVISATQINLTWTDPATDEAGFELEVSIDGATFNKLADLPAATVSFQHIGLTPARKYWYRILAKNTAGKSPYSNVATATTPDIPPAAPANLTALSVSTTQINLSWTDRSANEAVFQVERSPDGMTFTKIADLGPNAVSYANTGLTFNTTYHYRVRALNAVGASVYSNVASAATQNIPVPVAPENFTAVPTTYEMVQLRWTQVPGNVTAMVVERSKDDDAHFVEIARLGATVAQYEDRSKLEKADYYYRVKAINAGGSSPYSLVSIVRAVSIITSVPEKTSRLHLSGRTLVTELQGESRATLTIYNAQGMVRLNHTVGRIAYTDLPGFTPGMYIAVLETADALISRKILLE